MTFKVGFHGTATGIGSYAFKLDEAKQLVVAKSVNNAGWAMAVAKLAAASGTPHPVVMRWTNPGGGPEVPNYKLKPDVAAAEHWALVMKSVNSAPELHPYMGLIWVETINEPRTAVDTGDPMYNNMHPSDWLGWFAYYVAQHAKRDGVRWAAFGMNTGTPEKEDWRRGGMVEYLRECAANPDRLAVALHEYTLDLGPMAAKYPYLVGRFEWLYEVCDQLNIKRPTTLITELGWTYNDLPLETALPDIQWYNQLISKYPTIKGAYLWSLEGLPPLRAKLHGLMEPITEMALSSSPPPGGDPPPSCRGVPREQYERIYRVVPGHVDLDLREELYLQAAHDNRTIGPSYDDAGVGDLDSRTAELYAIPQADRQKFVDWYAKHYPGVKVVFKALPGDTDPLLGLKLGAPFRVPFVLTSPFNSKRDYGFANNLHEGADYDILGGPADSKEPVLACLDGTVSRSEKKDTSAYGHMVVVDSIYRGEMIQLWYAHMDARYVQVGQTVKQGEPVGELGGTAKAGEPRFAEHVHINLVHPGTGMDGYVVAKVRDPHPFMTMTPATQTGYSGPTVTFVPGIDQPASDWYWPSAKSVFDNVGKKLFPKFHDSGDSPKWYSDYKSPSFNVVRLIISPSFTDRNPQAIWNELKGGVQKYWPLGQRDFIFFNEVNLHEENLGKLWDHGIDFGKTFVQVANLAKAAYPGIRIWFPPMSPGGVSGDPPESRPQHRFIADANTQGALTVCWGITMHAYTAFTADEGKAVAELVNEVKVFQRMWALKKPLILGEFSVNRPAPGGYKARVYKALYEKLRVMPGIQAAYSFTSSWYGGQDLRQWGATWDHNQEGWKEGGIDVAFAALG